MQHICTIVVNQIVNESTNGVRPSLITLDLRTMNTTDLVNATALASNATAAATNYTIHIVKQIERYPYDGNSFSFGLICGFTSVFLIFFCVGCIQNCIGMRRGDIPLATDDPAPLSPTGHLYPARSKYNQHHASPLSAEYP